MSTSFHYGQIGSDVEIDSGSVNDYLGSSVSVSKDGLRMAVGAQGEHGFKGSVRMFSWDASTEEWISLGQAIFGTTNGDHFGLSVDMNEDGSRVIIGAPRKNADVGEASVYEFDDASQTWQLLGSDITPSDQNGQGGLSVVMNGAGNIVVIGSPYYDSQKGLVQAYELVGGEWAPMGPPIVSVYRSMLGSSIDLSADGKRLVTGKHQISTNTGSVEIYNFEDSSREWTLMKTIYGENYYDRLGSAVEISEDGNRIVVGVPFYDEGPDGSITTNSGRVHVYDYDGSDWTMLGGAITSPSSSDLLGRSVAISGDGSHIAVAAPGNDVGGSGLDNGRVDVYTYSEDEGSWITTTNAIYGDCNNDQYGEGQALTMDRFGNRFVIGAGHGNYYRGLVRAYEIMPGDASASPITECLTN